MIYREGYAEDIPACARIYDRLFAITHPRQSMTIPAERYFEDSIAGEELWVAETNGDIAGLVTIWRPEAFIHHLYIDAAWHRRGIGRALLQLAIARCGGRAELKCDEANRAAHTFYQAMGFRPASWGWSSHGPWIRFRY